MDDTFADIERAAAILCGPLGDHAPRCRKLVADYMDSGGRDFNREFMAFGQITDESLVESIREELARGGYHLRSLIELLEDSVERVLYLAPGVLEEIMRELNT